MALKDIDEAYAVSDDGRVWSNKTQKWLSQATSSNGYKTVRLHGKTFSVHRLVAGAWCENPCDKPFVNHVDGNKSNNSADNLEWVTPSENNNHAVACGMMVNSEKQRASASKVALSMGKANRHLSLEDAAKIRRLHNAGNTVTKISELFGVTRGVISNIVRNISYKEAA